MIRIGSLFSGVGLFELGLLWSLTRAGFDAEVAYQVEIDPFCRGVLARHFPRAARFDDVTKVRGADLPMVDILCGGFPCQDVSLAGTGEGLDGDRSGLWRDFARIIGETRPAIVCVENVAALIARGLDAVVADLERLGYRILGRVARASDSGAPHRRERVFLVAWRSDDVADPDRLGREGLAPLDGGDGRVDEQGGDDASRRRARVANAYSDALRLSEQRMSGGRARGLCDGGQAKPRHDRSAGRRDAEPRVGRMPDGLSPRLDRWPARPGEPATLDEPARAVTAYSPTRNARLHALGNGIVPQVIDDQVGPVVVALLEKMHARP